MWTVIVVVVSWVATRLAGVYMRIDLGRVNEGVVFEIGIVTYLSDPFTIYHQFHGGIYESL